MPKNLCQSSINSKKLYLSKITYPKNKFESYYITASEVEQVLECGLVPMIAIRQKIKEPKIAIILAQEKHPSRRKKDYCINSNYVDAIINAGGCPLFFSYEKVRQQLELMEPDGILLIGGRFRSSGEWYEKPTNDKADKRAKAYMQAIKYAKKHKLPTLGICAGMQMLACEQGAKMITEVKNHQKGGENVAHEVNITDDSLLAKIVNAKQIETNSSHLKAISPQFCGNCIITARADDGTVEAIELKNPWNEFVLGVQWHPEFFCKRNDAPSLNIFKSFIKATTKKI